ncbi:hypothetical protein [Halobacterium yunchengense]|uniref:hypothetical protein n=1 Tax=Halobacterium yunchengense TaxID=3108497 RepID=UPI00300885F1
MAVNPQWGELLIGAYHQRVTKCEIVSYNHRSEEQGNQMEADVIAIKSDIDTRQQTVYACEVVTHMDGKLYSGSMPDTDRWGEFGNKDYQHSLDKLWTKFKNDHRYVKNTFEEADVYKFQFWSPVVTGWENGGYLIDGLEHLKAEFEEETGYELELVINQDYTDRITTLKEKARGDTSDYGSPAFRVLQILENLK